MRTSFLSSFLAAGFPFALLGGLILASDPTDPIPERPNTTPTLTAGFHDWPHCDMEGRVETHPGTFFLPKWGPGALLGGNGCGSCGGGGSFNGDPHTAGLGVPHNESSSGLT